jgi:hypothetical protein
LAKLSDDGLGADIKPLKSLSLGSKALPPISSNANPAQLNMELNAKKKEAENALRQNQNLINEQKRQQEALAKSLPSAAEEAERRAAYMREQRDRLLAKKKQERDMKVKAEEERLNVAKESMREKTSLQSPPKNRQGDAKMSDSPNRNDIQQADIQELQRSMMRQALAQHMKQGLMESEEEKISKMHEDQFFSLDRKLMEVERVRQENQLRDQVLAENLRRQQAIIARNMQKSAAHLRNES